MNVKRYGWNDHFESQYLPHKEKGFNPGRIISVHKSGYVLVTEKGIFSGTLSGRLRYEIEFDGYPPVVGDWVVVTEYEEDRKAVIHDILKNYSCLSRSGSGFEDRNGVSRQIIAANIDTAFIVLSMNRDFSLRRIERYLVAVKHSGATPVVILNKADLCDEVDARLSQAKEVALDCEVVAVSAVTGFDMEKIRCFLREGRTSVFLGSSGVGKSTIINFICGGNVMEVNEISTYNDRGIHTTTHRELILTEQDGLIIDSPGMRELQLWETGSTISEVYDDIEVLAEACHFSDCTHTVETGCAVLAALDEGTIDAGRLEGYFKLLREKAHFDRKNDIKARINSKNRWKQISKTIKQIYKARSCD